MRTRTRVIVTSPGRVYRLYRAHLKVRQLHDVLPLDSFPRAALVLRMIPTSRHPETATVSPPSTSPVGGLATGRHQLREQLDDQGSDLRETRAYDGHAHLDQRPHGRGDVVEGITGLGLHVERREAETGRDNDTIAKISKGFRTTLKSRAEVVTRRRA